MDEYESGNVGLEAGLLPDDLKGFGIIRSKEDFWGALIGVIGASIFIGFLLGQLFR
ncbi:MAG TPA: hypothetical protein VFA81_11880 [Burkholderiales bacterium]|nr:hypothetical protein [Burkholderiales bacterium]